MAQRGAVQGQIFLDAFNPILDNAIRPRLLDGKREPCELKASDFDDAMYTVEVAPAALNTLQLSIFVNGWKELYGNGASDMLANTYKGMVSSETRPGHSLMLKVDLDNPGAPPDQLLKSLTELKRNLLAAPLDRAFDALREGRGGSVPPAAIPWRKSEVLYIVPQADRVTVIFAIDFKENDERAIAKSFLMEFVDAQRVANNSPPCTFTPDPPLELRSMPMPPGQRPVGFLSFVLNRAVPEDEAKAKKTAQGRAFNRV